MKSFKTALAVVFALAFAGLASAQTATTIRITGSTAFRKATIVAIKNILQPGFTYGFNGTTDTSANQAVFVGTTKVGNIPVVIKWSGRGSTGGIQTVSQLSPVITDAQWLSETLNTLTVAGTANLNSGAIYDAATGADAAMSDSFQSSTSFNGTGYATLTDTIVGVVPFVWTKGSSNDPAVTAALANVTNMTPMLARLLLSAGAPLSMFTGASVDSAVYVYPLGRDEDSGTRLCAFAEPGFGVFGSPIQYQATTASGTITAIIPWPSTTVLGIPYPAGHSGYSSGGTLATTLNTPVDASARDSFNAKFALIGYFGVNDANSVNGGNNNLSYNGVPYSEANVREGKYTFWAYEHLVYKSTYTGNGKTVADQIAAQIKTTDATQSGILLSTMNVSRSVEGGVIIHN